MTKRLTAIFGAILLLLTLAVFTTGQVTTTTVTKVATQNPDGTYTIVEYPVGKETIVSLNPVGLVGATGRATILRDPSGTTIKLNLTSLPADVTTMNVYTVDPSGVATLLGPVVVTNGVGTFTTTTQLSRFMLVASPEDALTAYDESTHIYFRSAVPKGLTVIPLSNATGEKVAAVATPATPVTVPETPVVVVPATPVVVPATPVVVPATPVVVPETNAAVVVATSDYVASMLGIPTFKKGDDTKLKIDFTGAMEGARANVFIEPHKNGKLTEVTMRFHDLKEAPKGQAYILWAVSPDNQFQKLGQIVNVKGRNEAEIKSETAFDDFGLLLTTEDLGVTTGTIIRPAGHRVAVITVIR